MELATLVESHRIYTVLRHFRLASTAYALPRFAFLTIDSASLIRPPSIRSGTVLSAAPRPLPAYGSEDYSW